LGGEFAPGDVVTADVQNGEIAFGKKKVKKKAEQAAAVS